jgi:hypothetical protein
MIFDTHLWGLALLVSLVAGLICALTTYREARSRHRETVREWEDEDDLRRRSISLWRGPVIFAGVAGFLIGLLLVRFILYYLTPPLLGALWGIGPLVTAIIITVMVVALLIRVFYGPGYLRLPLLVAIGSLVFILAVPAGLHLFFGTGLTQARFFASLPDVKVDDGADLPATDPQHIIYVPYAVAVYRAQTMLGNLGDNQGSIFQLNPDIGSYTTVGEHGYFLYPLEYASIWNQVGYFATAYETTPGFVVVDAEDTAARPEFKRVPLKYLPSAAFGQNLFRHLYLSGYQTCDFRTALLGVDVKDTGIWQPYWVVPCLKRAAGGVSGSRIAKVLTVDAQTGDIAEYAPDKVPAWVKRVIPRSLVEEYAEDWGGYGDPLRTRYWFGNGQYQQETEDFELHNSVGGDPLYVLPFSSNNGNDASATGVMAVDVRTRAWTFYKGFAGKPVGAPIRIAFESFPNSPVQMNHLTVESIQLYRIYGTLTWVAIYTRVVSDKLGSEFAGTAFLDAANAEAANVRFSPKPATALAAYREYLANGKRVPGISGEGTASKSFDGAVDRIGSAVRDGTTIYTFTVVGDAAHFFQVPLDGHPEAPLVHPGDRIVFTYLNTGDAVQAVSEFKDADINK